LAAGPFRRRRGLPIGNLTSQFLAKLYFDGFDHFVTEVLCTRTPYVRCVDDSALFHDDPAMLADWRERIERYLRGDRLRLHPRKTVFAPTGVTSAFLDSSCAPMAAAACPRTTCAASATACAMLGGPAVSGAAMSSHACAPGSHAENAHTWRLRHAIFRGRRHDPAFKALEAWTALLAGSFAGTRTPGNLRAADHSRSTTFARAGAITVAPGAH
jgi:hypothetical protein